MYLQIVDLFGLQCIDVPTLLHSMKYPYRVLHLVKQSLKVQLISMTCELLLSECIAGKSNLKSVRMLVNVTKLGY